MGSFHCSLEARDYGSQHNLQVWGQDRAGGMADSLLEAEREKRGKSHRHKV